MRAHLLCALARRLLRRQAPLAHKTHRDGLGPGRQRNVDGHALEGRRYDAVQVERGIVCLVADGNRVT